MSARSQEPNGDADSREPVTPDRGSSGPSAAPTPAPGTGPLPPADPIHAEADADPEASGIDRTGRGSDTGSPQDGEAAHPRARRRDLPPAWLRTSAVVVGGVVVIIALLVLAAAVLPTWWAEIVGRQVDGVGSAGILWGLAYGAGFTLLFLIGVGVAVRARWHWKVRLGIGVVALLLLVPNLLTLAVSMGLTERTQHARTLMAIQAPNFRGATAAGVGATLVLGAVAAVVIHRMTASRRELTELRKQARGQ